MAFKARNKDNGIEKIANVDDLNNSHKNKQNYIIPEITNFHEQAIQILNILDSKGINIYDENRAPGMYLKRDSQETINNKKLKNILSVDKNNHQQEQSNKNSNIIKFMLNQK